jgi:plastocyanin
MNTMRRLTVGLAVAAALIVAAPATAATRTVSIFGSAFSPKSVTVTEGDTVVWQNKDNDFHQVLADKGQFVSAILRSNQTYSFTFKAAGTYAYHDELHPKLKGTIVVKGAPPTLTFTVSTSIVTYGDQATLSGQVSSKAAGETVTIYYQPYPQPNLIERATVLTGADGTFSFLVQPRILTTYQASWKGAFSLPASVEVRPKVTLGRNGGWLIHVYAGRSLAGRGVQLQRLNPSTGQWVTLRLARLNAANFVKVTPDVKLPKGTSRLRAAISVNQAGAGFLGSMSSLVTWHVT